MIDIVVRTIGERLHEQSLSMAAAGLGKMTQWVRTTGLDVRYPGRPLGSGAAERLGHARCCLPVALRRSIRFAVAAPARRGVRGQIVGHAAVARLCKGD